MTIAEKVDEIKKATQVAQEILDALLQKYPSVKIQVKDNKIGVNVNVHEI